MIINQFHKLNLSPCRLPHPLNFDEIFQVIKSSSNYLCLHRLA